jgi:hypothetical protein
LDVSGKTEAELTPALILQGFGLSTFDTILYNMIPGAIGIVSNILWAGVFVCSRGPADWSSSALLVQYTKRKSPVLLGVTVFPLAAAAALYALPRGPQYKSELLAVYFILQVFQCITAIIFSWTWVIPAQSDSATNWLSFANTAGHTKKTTTTGMLYMGLTVGNIVGPQLYKQVSFPLSTSPRVS